MGSDIYDSIIQTKSGKQIPVLKNGHTIESRYNPESEAIKIIKANNLSDEDKIILILGVGSGSLINAITSIIPETKILAVEFSQNDIAFIKQIPEFQNITENSNINLFTVDELEQKLICNYTPALYGNLKIIPNLVWIEEVKKQGIDVQKKINSALKIISADFSVQSHFGKIWQKNILSNLRLFAEKSSDFYTEKPDISKKAVILGAGPSIDKKIVYLKQNREALVLISTDTAFQSLIRNQITPDYVISLDGQLLSENHFYESRNCSEKTSFLLSLTSQNSIARKLLESKCRLNFFSTGHPLETAAVSSGFFSFPLLFSGSGTVTIAALDFALKAGFKNIEVFGADFSYHHGKPYAKGTYLDNLYSIGSSKICTVEKNFASLMFRTELISDDENHTTEILNSYRKSLEEFLKSKNYAFIRKDYDYIIEKKDSISKNSTSKDSILREKNNSDKSLFEHADFFDSKNKKSDYKKFIKMLLEVLEGAITEKNYDEKIFFILPYIAYLRANTSKNNWNEDFTTLIKLAYTNIVGYNNSYEK